MKKKFALLMTALVSTSALALAGCKTNIKWIDEKICKHEYEFVEITLEPTCTEEGERLMECVDCGKQKTEVMEKIAHEEVVTPGKDPTCTEDGYTEKIVCNVCQEVLVVSEARSALGHTEKVTAEGKDPTCTETGLTDEIICEVCEEVLQVQEVIPMIGHSDNNEDYICDICGDTPALFELQKYANSENVTESDYEMGSTIPLNSVVRIYRPTEGTYSNAYLSYGNFTAFIYSIGRAEEDDYFFGGNNSQKYFDREIDGDFAYIDHGKFIDFYFGEFTLSYKLYETNIYNEPTISEGQKVLSGDFTISNIGADCAIKILSIQE